jgi:flagellar FliJ protein
MQDIQALTTLLEHATTHRDHAQATLQRAIAAAQAAQTQAVQLVGYRGEYERRFGAQFRQGSAIELVHCYHGFMGRLDHAVKYQDSVSTRAQSQVESARELLMECELRVASVRKLIERRQAEAALAAHRREQKASDEFASRQAWQRQAQGGGAFAIAP